MNNCEKENCIHFKVCEVKNYNYACPYFEPERPKGEWIEGENGNIKCNQCGSEIRYSYLIGNEPDFPNFCPNCGADMRKAEAKPKVSGKERFCSDVLCNQNYGGWCTSECPKKHRR